MKFDKNWSGRVAYLYFDFGSETFELLESGVQADIHANVFRIALSYTLN